MSSNIYTYNKKEVDVYNIDYECCYNIQFFDSVIGNSLH